EVNHDLIAAGHPRLNFEFATYMRAMPPHWHERDRETGEPAGPAFPARAWSAGQSATVKAALRLLDHRGKGPWPEFTEQSCFDCHHELRPAGRGFPSFGGQRGLPGWHRAFELERLGGGVLEPMRRPIPVAADVLAAIAAIQGKVASPPSAPGGLARW